MMIVTRRRRDQVDGIIGTLLDKSQLVHQGAILRSVNCAIDANGNLLFVTLVVERPTTSQQLMGPKRRKVALVFVL